MRRIQKRVMASVLALGLFSTTPVWAQEVTVLSKAAAHWPAPVEKTMQEILQLMPELGDFQLERSAGNEGDYQIVLRKNDHSYASFHINGNKGQLLMFQYVKEEQSDDKPVNLQQAEKQAVSFVNKMLANTGEEYNVYKVTPLFYREEIDGKQVVINRAEIMLRRMVNGIPFENDMIAIEVDASHQIIQYTRVRDKEIPDSAFPDPRPAIAKADIEKQFPSYMKLKYIENLPVERDKETGTIIKMVNLLEYTPTYVFTNSWYIDAATGKINYVFDLDREKREPLKLKPSAKTIVLKSSQEAAQFVKQQLGVELDASMKLKEATEAELGWKSYDWSLGKQGVSVKVDPNTGILKSFGLLNQAGKTPINQNTAQKVAIGALEAYSGTDIREVVLSVRNLPGKDLFGDGKVVTESYEFKFYKSHGGIPVIGPHHGEAYTVSIDPTTGKVSRFENRYSESATTLPDAQNAITAEKAAELYLKAHPLQLVYTIQPINGQAKEKPVLAYVASGDADAHIDAITGEVVTQK